MFRERFNSSHEISPAKSARWPREVPHLPCDPSLLPLPLIDGRQPLDLATDVIKGSGYADRDCKVVQRDQRLWLHPTRQGGKDVFVHVSAVERSGMRGLAEGMKISYDVEADRKSGKEAATNLKAV